MPSLLLVSTTVNNVLRRHASTSISISHVGTLCIFHLLLSHIHIRRKHKHPRGFRHATLRPIDKPSLESLLPSIHVPPWPFPIYHVTVPSREASVPVNGPYGSVLSPFYLVQATYMVLRRSFFRSVYVRSYLCYFFGMSPRCPAWFFCYRCSLISTFEGYMAVPFGTQQDLSRFLLPMVSAECCNWRWSLRALTQDPGCPRWVPSFQGWFSRRFVVPVGSNGSLAV